MNFFGKKKAIIVDLDGTLCDVEHRVHFVLKNPKDWDGFNQNMHLDRMNVWCLEIIKAMRALGYQTIFVTGRGEDHRKPTVEWLIKHQVPYDLLLMRPARDHREDNDIKEELYLSKVKSEFDILFVIDDRKSVVERWRKLELVCLQCAPGDF